MIEAFYIETKFYMTDANGTDYQMADGGDLPIVYRALSKALKRAENITQLHPNIMGYTVTQPNEGFPDKPRHCHYACTLTKAKPQVRLEIRLYSFMLH